MCSVWDPEKMELRRMVDRLLEERRYMPDRPEDQAMPHKVKLPPFYRRMLPPGSGS